MAVCAPVITAELADWVSLGGGNSGCVGDSNHVYGFHRGANEVGPTDYSRVRSTNGAFGSYPNWGWACAGDFSHRNDEKLRAMHREVLSKLMAGQFPMICEFIGKPWSDKPVVYWARWNGIKNLDLYTGAGHTHWTHLSWDRAMADQRAYLWKPPPPPPPVVDWRKELVRRMDVVNLSKVSSNSSTWVRGQVVKVLQGALLANGHGPRGLVDASGRPDGVAGPATRTLLGAAQAALGTGLPSRPSVPDFIAGPATWGRLLNVRV